MITVSAVCTQLISPKECYWHYSCVEERSERTLAGNVQELASESAILGTRAYFSSEQLVLGFVHVIE